MITMGFLKLAILFMVVQITPGAPTGIKKRAHILPPRSNSSDGEPPPDETVKLSVSTLTTTGETKKDVCPIFMVPHSVGEVTVCCVPIFNCGVGHGIAPCEKDGEKDRCVSCPPGMLQKNNVSSLNMEEADCYSERNTENCPLDDTKPSRNYSGIVSCLLKCECKNEECWFGKDPCACNLSDPCPVNFTMNRLTGACERCPLYAYKDHVGCGTCTVIPELWAQRNSLPTTAQPNINNKTTLAKDTDVTEKKAEEKNKEPEQTVTTETVPPIEKQPPDRNTIQFPVWAIGMISGLLVFFMAIGIVAIVLWLKRCKNSGSSTHLLGPETNNDQRLMAENVPELADGSLNLRRGNPVFEAVNYANKDEKNVEILGAVGGVDALGRENERNIEDIGAVGGVEEENRHGTSSMNDLLKIEEQRDLRKQIHLAPRYKMSDGVSAEREPLLETREISADSGAIPKNTDRNRKQSGRTKSESSAALNNGVIYFNKCKIKGPVFQGQDLKQVHQTLALKAEEDSSLFSSDFSDMDSVQTEPKSIENEYKPLGPCKEDVKHKDVKAKTDVQAKTDVHKTDVHKRLTVNVNESNKGVGSNGDSNFENIDERDSNESAHSANNVIAEGNSGNSVLNIDDSNKTNIEKQVHHTKEYFNEPLTPEARQKRINTGVDDCAISSSTEGENLVDTIKASRINASPRTSDSDSDDSKNGNGKRGIKPFGNDNKTRPTAIIPPVRQNSVQEPTMAFRHNSGDSFNNQAPYLGDVQNMNRLDSNFVSYTSSIASDSYAFVHMSRQQDVANLEELNSLHSESIAADDIIPRDSTAQQHTDNSESSESHNSSQPMEQRMGPVGCSMTETDADSFVHRPDLQMTYCKTVRETDAIEGMGQISEETDVKTPLSDSPCDTNTKEIICVTEEKDKSREPLDEIEIEKLKNARAIAENEQVDETVIKADNVETNKDIKAEKTDSIVESDVTQNAICVETENYSDTSSVEIPIDCLESGTQNAVCVETENYSDTSSVEIPIDCLESETQNKGAVETAEPDTSSVEISMDLPRK